MPNTSVHFPSTLLEDLDHLASEKGLSRNRLIVEACRQTLRRRKAWPAGFFDDSRFVTEDLEALRAGCDDFTKNLLDSRADRKEPPF